MKRIVTLDYGHCEIAATTPVYSGGKFERIDNLRLNSERDTVIPAEIGYEGELLNYFKASPVHFDEVVEGSKVKVKRRDLMSALFAQIISDIKDYNDSIGADDQILLLVGCPTSSEWTSEENRKAYESLIKEATGVDEVRVIPESRAAMFSALADGKGRKISAVEGAVVYDFGSSTVDCTYMKTGEHCMEFSWNLGAREIEKELGRMMRKEASDLAKSKGMELIPMETSKLERTLRNAKEMYYNGDLDESNDIVSYRFETDNGKKLVVSLDIDDGTIETAVKSDLSLMVDNKRISKGWKSYCSMFFRSTKSEIEKNGHEIREIVLTGGASKMPFVKEYALEVFPPEEDYVVTCSINPSYSVSNGLAWVGMVDEKEDEIVSIVTKNVMESDVADISKLKTKLKVNVGEKIYNMVMSAVNDWADSQQDLALTDLEAGINREYVKNRDAIDYAVRRCTEVWYGDITKKIHLQLEEEIKKNFGPEMGEKIEIPSKNWEDILQGLKDTSIDIDRIIDGIDINSAIRKATMASFVIASATLWSWFPPHIIGSTIAVVLQYMNNMINNNKGQLCNAKIRNRVREDFGKDRQKREILRLCEESIKEVIDADAQLTEGSMENRVNTIATAAYEIVMLKFEM